MTSNSSIHTPPIFSNLCIRFSVSQKVTKNKIIFFQVFYRLQCDSFLLKSMIIDLLIYITCKIKIEDLSEMDALIYKNTSNTDLKQRGA